MTWSFSSRSRAAVLGSIGAAVLAGCGGGDPAGESPGENAAQAAKAPLVIRAQGSPESAAREQPEGNAARRAQRYIVQLADRPVVGYAGGVAGYARTKPAAGEKMIASDSAVVDYAARLTARQDEVLRAAGATKLHAYKYTFNGFAAELNEAQLAKLAATPGVVSIVKDEIRKLDTASTPDFLGLAGRNGVWNRSGARGENVVIGIIDSGIWPEHRSLSDSRNGDEPYRRPRGWNGVCQTGERFATSDCNRKLIGARYYNAGLGGDTGIKEAFPSEYNSPRDFNGHGTHTATTAGGNAGVRATGDEAQFGRISGMAPRARIAAYKVCWGGGLCPVSDSVAAIDQAVEDGVDVINFSIGGTRDRFMDPVALAFMSAADAGVFIAASAGNSGPTASTVDHGSPWLTTVAAGTHNRQGFGTVSLGDGSSLTGASLASPVGPAPLIDGAAAGLPGADPARAALCFTADDNGGTPVLDPAKVAGKIVVCDRGGNARPSKSLAVRDAGGVGMVYVNTSPSSLNTEPHAVPTVHLQDTSRPTIKAYAATAGATASIASGGVVYDAPAPDTAIFSSRGPLIAGGGDLLKPDIIAPGQDIVAGVAPPNNGGRLFGLMSGTSMSSPHIAGIAALMKELRPRWSPMAIKSALMTTAGNVLDGPDTDPAVIFGQGAGHVQPSRMNDPGLVFDHGFDDWTGFLCGTGQLVGGGCEAARIDPSDLNVASIAIGELAGVQTVKRRVTNVASRVSTYRASVSGMAGIGVQVSPANLRLRPGETKEFSVTFTRTTAAANAPVGGQLKLDDGAHTVRVPLVIVRPLALVAPAEVQISPSGGSFNVTFGFSGPFSAQARGLVAAAVASGNAARTRSLDACSLTVPGGQQFPVTIAPGTALARFSLFDADVPPDTDFDMCVFRGGTLVGASGSPTSAEQVDLVNPAAGDYIVVVQPFAIRGPTAIKLYSWQLGAPPVARMALTAPSEGTAGGTGTIGVSFSGLAAGTKYLGQVLYAGGAFGVMPTIVRVDAP